MYQEEKSKMLNSELYNPLDEGLVRDRAVCKALCAEYNSLAPSEMTERTALMKKILGSAKGDFLIEPSFYCDYGYNISIGKNFYANHNLVILDPAKVEIGDNVFIGPNCGFYTAEHPLNVIDRNSGLEYAKPIKVCDNVWIGGNVTILAGVTIGENSVIGAGSVVTKPIPANVVAFGNPCKVAKTISV